MISELRRVAASFPDATAVVYALMVFDQALIQLGGLAFAVSRNKIRDPEQAAKLAARAANWIELVCPCLYRSEDDPAARSLPTRGLGNGAAE